MKLLYIVWCAAFVSSNALNLTDSSSKAVKNRTSRKLGRSKLVTNIIPKTLEAEEDNVLLDQWKQIEQNAQSFTTSLVFESFLPTLERLFEGNNVSLQCQKSIYRVLADATKLKKYAIQILDSSGKFPPSGILEGTLTDLGRYDECTQVDEVIQGSDDDPITSHLQGQYCSIIVRPPLPRRPRFHTICNQLPVLANFSASDKVFRWLGQNAHYFYYVPFRVGICTPSTCTSQDIQQIVSKLANSFNMSAHVLNTQCDIKKLTYLNKPQVMVILAFSLLILIVISGTAVDIFEIGAQKSVESTFSAQQTGRDGKSKQCEGYWFKTTNQVDRPTEEDSLSNAVTDCSQWIKILLCFSLKRNGASLLCISSVNQESDKSKQNESLDVIHGLRVFTMSWVILGHTYGLVNPQVHSHAFYAKEMYTSFLYQGLLNATLSVDTYFFISGLLTIYVTWKRIDKTGKFQPIAFTVLRYTRLTPAYAAIIGFALIFPLLSSGPLWRETTEPIAEACYQSWWTNLLYINNFVETDKLCLMHSWYLSNDFQFHLFALVFLFLLMKSKFMAMALLVAVSVACTLFTGAQTFINNYPPTIVSTSPAVEDRWNYILDYYYKPWPHLPSYCIGLVTGYALASKKRLDLTDTQKRILWVLATLTSWIVLYGVYPWNLGWNISSVVTALYSSTFRTTWTACIAYATFVLLTTKEKGFMATCLSWNGLVPLSRLTYMAYLVHPFVIWYHSGSIQERFHASHYNQLHLFLGHYLLTYIVAFIAGILFESPFMAMQKLFLSSGAKQEPGLGNSAALAAIKKKKELKRNKSFLYHVSFKQNTSASNVLYVNKV